jgi:polyphosphate kinase 2 (PPK2 family)
MYLIINSKDFVCGKGTRSISKSGPTKIDPVYKSKEQYQELLREHVGQLSSQQELRYASNRYVVLLIFQATNAAGKGCAISHVMSGGKSRGGSGEREVSQFET